MKLTATFPGGTRLDGAAKKAIGAARGLRRSVSMVFNDTEVEIDQHDSPDDVIYRWSAQRAEDQAARKKERCDKLHANISALERMIEEAGDDCLGIRGLRSHAKELREELARERAE